MKKRWIIALSIMLIAGLLALQKEVCAKTLEELLLEKGAITEEEYKQLTEKETTQTKPVNYRIGRGFTFTSDDENFQLSLGGGFKHATLFLIMMLAMTSVNFKFNG
jgi:phosphate-selective porin OprO and OprP